MPIAIVSPLQPLKIVGCVLVWDQVAPLVRPIMTVLRLCVILIQSVPQYKAEEPVLAQQIAFLEAIAAEIVFVKVQLAVAARLPMIVFPDYHAHQIYASAQTAIRAQVLVVNVHLVAASARCASGLQVPLAPSLLNARVVIVRAVFAYFLLALNARSLAIVRLTAFARMALA